MKKKFIASGLICIILTSSVAFYIYSGSQEVEMKQSSPVSLLKVSSKNLFSKQTILHK